MSGCSPLTLITANPQVPTPSPEDLSALERGLSGHARVTIVSEQAGSVDVNKTPEPLLYISGSFQGPAGEEELQCSVPLTDFNPHPGFRRINSSQFHTI